MRKNTTWESIFRGDRIKRPWQDKPETVLWIEEEGNGVLTVYLEKQKVTKVVAVAAMSPVRLVARGKLSKTNRSVWAANR